MKINLNTLATTLIGAAVIWAALMAFVPEAKQARLFYAEGREMLSDFVMPRQCAAAADPYEADAVGPQDRCYAALMSLTTVTCCKLEVEVFGGVSGVIVFGTI